MKLSSWSPRYMTDKRHPKLSKQYDLQNGTPATAKNLSSLGRKLLRNQPAAVLAPPMQSFRYLVAVGAMPVFLPKLGARLILIEYSQLDILER